MSGSGRRRHGRGPVLVRAADWLRPSILRAAAPGDGAGSFAFSNHPITPFMGPSPRTAPTRSGS